MNKCYLMLAAGLFAFASQAKTTWQTPTLGTVTVDTLYHATVGPGTTQTQIHISYTRGGAAAESKVTYTTSDLTNPYLEIKAGVASKVINGKPQTVKGMMADRTVYGKHYFAGVNGDFAGLSSTASTPCGLMIEDGTFLNKAATLSGNIPSNYLIIGPDGEPTIAASVETVRGNEVFGSLVTPKIAIDTLRFNDYRWGHQILAFNEFYGYGGKRSDSVTENEPGHTNTNQWGDEAELIPLEDNIVFGKEAEFIVRRKTTQPAGGNMKIPHGGMVLSACGNSRQFVTDLKINDRVKIKYPFKADGVDVPAREAIGGFGITVKGGKLQKAPSKLPSDIAAKTPRARTSVGYNADKTKFIMAVVQEETSGGKNGMTIFEFGEIMQALGCTDALNLDGGGSSVMFVENLGQRSNVQGIGLGGYTRSVANGLFAVSTAPETQEVARIEFVDKSLTIKPGRGYQPVIYAYNKYGALVSTGLQNYTLSAKEAKFDSSNRKMIAPTSGYFALTATYKGITTSIPVKVDAAGVAGSDPATAPSFKGNEFVPMLEAPVERPTEYAQLQDVTPQGLDFDKYEVGTKWKFAALPETAPSGTWSAPSGVFKQEVMDADGQMTLLHAPGVAIDNHEFDAINQQRRESFTIQEHPNELVGKCLVFNQTWAPGASSFGWPSPSKNSDLSMQLTFYADPRAVEATNAEHPMRFRMVFQLLSRGRHERTNGTGGMNEIPNIYATATNDDNAWALSYNNVGDNITGAEFPVGHHMNFRWKNEGSTIAEIPAYPELYTCEEGEIDPWDNGGKQVAGDCIMNGDRFIVYEYDMYGMPEKGTIAVHVNFLHNAYYYTVNIKEVKFFNVLNGAELLGTSGKKNAPASRANAGITATTASGSLLGTRSITYRYYTPEGIKEIEAEGTTTGIDDVVVDGEDVEAPVEYYNLQGIRVENPANGIYIKRQGSKVTKVLVK